MKTKYTFINFVRIKDKPKTSVWSCRNNRSGSQLGEVEYYPGWRQYVFIPTLQSIYSIGCMDDISDFIKQLEKLRKEST